MSNSVVLPNGFVVNDVPETATQEDIIEKALSKGWATAEDFGIEEEGFLDKASDFLQKASPFSGPDVPVELTPLGLGIQIAGGGNTQRTAFAQSLSNQFTDAGLSGLQALPEFTDLISRYRQYSRLPAAPSSNSENLFGMAADAIGDTAKEKRADPSARFKIDEDYADTWTTDFGGALGSMAAFMGAGSVGGPFGYLFAGGTGLTQGRERLEAAKAEGQEVSQGQEDLALTLHTIAGLSEMAPIANILKRVPSDIDAKLKDKIFKRIKEITSSGIFESAQEQAAGIAHDAIEANVYNPNLDTSESLYGKIVDLNPEAISDVFTSREATVSAAAGAFTDFAQGLFQVGARGRRFNINDEAQRAHEQNLRDRKQAEIEKIRENVSRSQIGALEEDFVPPEQIDLFADDVDISPVASALGNDPIYRSAVYVAKTIGPDFANIEGDFEVVEGDIVTDDRGNTSRSYEVVIGDQRYGQPLGSYNDAAKFASVLFDQRRAARLNNTISQQIQSSPEILSEEDVGTMASYGLTALDPEQTTYTSSAVNLAGGTTLDNGYDETASIYEQQEKNAPEEKLTIAQKINLNRINNGFASKNTFTVDEAREALGKDFDNLADPKINTTLETESYSVEREGEDKKIVIVSSDGKRIRGKKLSAVEYQQQLDAGKRPNKDKKYPFKTLRDARAYADLLNRNRGTSAVPDDVLGDDIASVLQSKNISSSVNSPEVLSIIGKILGIDAPANIESLSKSERKLAYTKLRSLPRFSRPTKLINFRAEPETTQVDQEAQLALPAPATNIEEIQVALDEAMDQAGLSDVKANINFGLNNVLEDNQGNLVFGIRPRRPGEESVESFGGPGSPIVVDSTVDGEAFYSTATGQIFFGLDRLPEGLSTEEKIDAVLDVLSHEQIHAMRALDLFTDAEYTLLRKTAKQRNKEDGKSYFEWAQETYPDLSEVDQVEESIAELVRDYRSGKGAFAGRNKLSGKPKTLTQRVVNFLKGAANFVDGAGFNTFEELASSIQSGAVGGRERGQIRSLRETEAQGVMAPDSGFAALEEEELTPVARTPQRPDFIEPELDLDDPNSEVEIVSSLNDRMSRRSPAKAKTPKKTVKAYKLFRIEDNDKSNLFPLFVDADTPVETDVWVEAKAGEINKRTGKVKSKLGDLAYRPGWHSGDTPSAKHIGGISDNRYQGKKPDYRKASQVWAEVEVPADVDWQSEANSRASTVRSGPRKGLLNVKEAHITDQIPDGGHYRYKTNPNMEGNWIISGSMKVNKLLTPSQKKKALQKSGIEPSYFT